MTVLAALICAALTGSLMPRAAPLAPRRLDRLLAHAPDVRPTPGTHGKRSSAAAESRRATLARRTAAALAGLATATLIGGVPGVLAGVLAYAICMNVLSRMEPRSKRLRRARLIADLPVAVDLLAACLRGGSSWGEAVTAVADAVGGPVGDELHGVAAQIRLGADPATAWLSLTAEPALAPLARTAARAAVSGTALAPTLARLAQDQRRTARSEALARARSAGIRAVAPLGLCFLPAFILLGVVPAIAGIASTLLLPW